MSQEEIVVPKGWELKTIEEICTKITDGEHLKPKTVSEGVPFVSAKDLKDDGVDFNHVLYVDKTDAEIFRKKCNPEKNDILIGSRGSIGKICLVNTEQIFCLLGSVILLKPSLSIESKFISYFFKSGQAQNQLLNASGHSVVKALYLRDIKKLKIPVPEKQTQKQIVAKLDHILGELEVKKKEILFLIEQNKERIDFFEKNWMSYVIDREIEKHPQREKWESKNLKDCVKDIEKRDPTKTPNLSFNYVEIGSVSSDKKISGSKQIIGLNAPSRARNVIRAGDVIYGTTRPYYRNVVLITKAFDNEICSTGFCVLRIKSLEILPEYLFYYMLSNIANSQILKPMRGGSYPAVSNNDVIAISIPLPPIPIQKQIIQNIKSAEEKFQLQKKQFENIKNNYDSKIKYINHIQTSVLDSAFSGKLLN